MTPEERRAYDRERKRAKSKKPRLSRPVSNAGTENPPRWGELAGTLETAIAHYESRDCPNLASDCRLALARVREKLEGELAEAAATKGRPDPRADRPRGVAGATGAASHPDQGTTS